MELYTLIAIFIAHFIGDFILQTDKMALNKSTSNKWLFIHSFTYSIPLVFFGVWYAIINGVIHMVIDYITSRAASYLWKKEERHWFFTVIGLDQTLHMITLITTYFILKGI